MCNVYTKYEQKRAYIFSRYRVVQNVDTNAYEGDRSTTKCICEWGKFVCRDFHLLLTVSIHRNRIKIIRFYNMGGVITSVKYTRYLAHNYNLLHCDNAYYYYYYLLLLYVEYTTDGVIIRCVVPSKLDLC